MPNNWIAVASADHVRRGVAGGFMQVCHGKQLPLLGIKPGDRVCYYSPTARYGGSHWLRALTAFGTVAESEPYLAESREGRRFYRRNVDWRRAKPASIYDLLPHLDLTAGRSDLGRHFRFGLVRIGAADAARIAAAMGVGVEGMTGAPTAKPGVPASLLDLAA